MLVKLILTSFFNVFGSFSKTCFSTSFEKPVHMHPRIHTEKYISITLLQFSTGFMATKLNPNWLQYGGEL